MLLIPFKYFHRDILIETPTSPRLHWKLRLRGQYILQFPSFSSGWNCFTASEISSKSTTQVAIGLSILKLDLVLKRLETINDSSLEYILENNLIFNLISLPYKNSWIPSFKPFQIKNYRRKYDSSNPTCFHSKNRLPLILP